MIMATSVRSELAERRYLQHFLISVGVVAAFFLWEGNQGFDLWDEGFLWYGAQRTLLGEVPIRDFMAYDPGRYYWSAALMALWGDNGILALRGSVAVFQIFGLFIGLTSLSSSVKKQNILFWILLGITFAVWMFPLYKLFDVVLSIALLAGLSFFVEKPSSIRCFFLGVLVGLIAVFGRNHGVYGVVGSLSVMAFLLIGQDWRFGLIRSVAIWFAGVVVGYMPILAMLAIVPRFPAAFLDSIRLLFRTGVLPLPIPWPWNVHFDQNHQFETVRSVLLGGMFVAIVVFGVLSILWVIGQKRQQKQVSSVLVASAFLALPYAHYAYSRADTLHLAMGIIPFVTGCVALLANQGQATKWGFFLLLCAGSMVVMTPLHPGWLCYSSQQCVESDVGGDRLKTHPNIPIEVGMLRELSDRFAPKERSFIVVPFWPGAYAVMRKKSPMWGIYLILPRSESFERSEIERIESANPGFVVIIDVPLDGREELRFSNTNPKIERYIRENFEFLGGVTPDPGYKLYVNRK